VRDERSALIAAGLTVLRGKGSEGLTVGDVLAEAGLSTRAFYRHFDSKDALVLAIYAYDAASARERLQKRVAEAESPYRALEVWIEETLGLAFDARRARRTRPLAQEGLRLQAQFPKEFDAIVAAVLDPLVEILRAFPGSDPHRDARSIHALTWALVVERMNGGSLTMSEAKAHVFRYCRAAIGADA
jgi:AcrR family transcriptional regulator